MKRRVEYFRLWSDRTWDTDFIEIDAEVDGFADDEAQMGSLHTAVERATKGFQWRNDAPPEAVGYYCDAPELLSRLMRIPTENEVFAWDIEQCMRFLYEDLGVDLNTVDLSDYADDLVGWRTEVMHHIESEDD